ncbi:hypothetical protein KC332_g10885 [Hortaea werneckii]|nr:hypothetical protein KC358_g7431 [Hortaea werneckii]KAI6833859.1 hypothetical protein KC350_g6867 [Hortaea werneckii]KAI6900266.1 hypothetical protein KC348_g16898 [Hortaea werneckii]KAI6930775.1 hypothetical protein KC341_g10014 [Hortaea werneckii]KAI6963959.1 hypothetical protein KC321_g10944 [Hortaea werneckii]
MMEDVKKEVKASSPIDHENAMNNDSYLHSDTTDFAIALSNEPEDQSVAKADCDSDTLFLQDDEDSIKTETPFDRAANEAPSPEEVKVDNKAYDQANVQHLPATAVMKTTSLKLDDNKAAHDQLNVQRLPEAAVTTTPPPKRTKSEQAGTTLQISSCKKSKASINRTPPYNDEWEKESSQLAVDQPCFTQAEKLVPVICDLVSSQTEMLKSKGYHDEEIANIVHKLRDLRFVDKTYGRNASKPTGCLGVTAAGKSTLMNCLTSQENIAAECDEGESGTSVIQELVMAEIDQIETFRAVVYYHANRKIEALVKKHFQTIHDFQNLNTEDLDTDEYSAWQADYETALIFFYTILCERDEFMSADATLTYFNNATSRDDSVMLQQLSTWILEYLTSLTRGEGATVMQANTMREMNRELAKFKGPAKTGIDGSRRASPWPLVRTIKMQLRARILSEGAVLADLPGLSDTNKLRVQATRDYIKNCGTVIIVHPILRIQSQDTVWNEVNECIRNGKQSNLVIVCTKVDDIKHSRERETSVDDRGTLDKLRGEADGLAVDIAELEEALEDAGESQYRSIDLKLKEKKTLRARKEAEWKEENIVSRNRRNIKAIQAKYRKAVDDPCASVPVFCVSNTIYQQHMKGFDNENPPDLSVEATGIPGLRKYLFEIPARRKHGALQKLGRQTLPRVLLALEMQCCKTRLERKQDIECKVVKPLNDFKDELHTLKALLNRKYEAALQDTLHEQESKWYEAANALHTRWVKYKYAAKYFAFCRHSGDWKDPSKKNVQWNVQIVDLFADDMMNAFTEVKKAFNEIQAEFIHKLDRLLEELDTDLHESPQLMGLNLDSLHKVIELTRAAVNDKTNKLFRKLDNTINNVRYNAMSAETTESYVKKSMQTAYEKCKACKGTGLFKNIKHIIGQKLNGPQNVFLDVKDGAIADFENYVDLWIMMVENKVGAEFQAVIDNFNGRFVDVEEEDETKHGFRKELLQTVQKALAMTDTELKAELDACAQFH